MPISHDSTKDKFPVELPVAATLDIGGHLLLTDTDERTPVSTMLGVAGQNGVSTSYCPDAGRCYGVQGRLPNISENYEPRPGMKFYPGLTGVTRSGNESHHWGSAADYPAASEMLALFDAMSLVQRQYFWDFCIESVTAQAVTGAGLNDKSYLFELDSSFPYFGRSSFDGKNTLMAWVKVKSGAADIVNAAWFGTSIKLNSAAQASTYVALPGVWTLLAIQTSGGKPYAMLRSWMIADNTELLIASMGWFEGHINPATMEWTQS